MTGKTLMEELVAGLEGVTAGSWRRQTLGGSSTVLTTVKPPNNDRRSASYGYRDEEYCLAHAFLDDDDKPRMDFVCFGHADAAHIARCSPDNILAIAEYVRSLQERAERLERALQPFAKEAGTWGAEFPDTAVVKPDFVTLADFRRARLALQSKSTEESK